MTDLVEAMHLTIGGGPAILGRPLEGPTRAITGRVYGSIRGVTKLVGASIDLALAQLAPLLGEGASGPEREAVLAVLNGVLGDYLSATGNPLAIQMQLRQDGHPLELERRALRALLPQASSKLLVLVHGSCLNDRQWLRLGHDHGAALARDLGYTPVYLLYNSGLHVSTNGRALAALLEELVAEWPVPLDELVIVGHSMGGLVARSACHYGEAAGHRWRRKLRQAGLPRLAAPRRAARARRQLDRAAARREPLQRSAGAAGKDPQRRRHRPALRHRARRALAGPRPLRARPAIPGGSSRCPTAWSATPSPRRPRRAPGAGSPATAWSRWTARSAATGKPELTLAFPEAHQWIGFGMGHLDLLSRAEVYATLRAWLGP